MLYKRSGALSLDFAGAVFAASLEDWGSDGFMLA